MFFKRHKKINYKASNSSAEKTFHGNSKTTTGFNKELIREPSVADEIKFIDVEKDDNHPVKLVRTKKQLEIKVITLTEDLPDGVKLKR